MEKESSNLAEERPSARPARSDNFATYSTRPASFSPISLAKKASSGISSNKKSTKRGVSMPFKKILPTLVALVLVVALAFGGGWLGARTYNNHLTASNTPKTLKQQYVSDESSLIAGIAKDVGQSVVSVDVESQSVSPDFFGFDQTSNQESAGTGFIISSDGIILTNRHVIPDGTTSVSVTLADGTTYNNVQVIGRSNDNSSQDVAFLKITNLNGKTLVPVTLGDSSQMQVGDEVVAIGNALGQFQNTVTSGIISGYGRDVTAGDQSGTETDENLTDLFQTDAAINEGNSGGPLVNINGEVIGVNTAVASDAQNIGFAQPINDLKGLINSVLGSGQLQQPYLGVHYVSVTPDVQGQYNLKVNHGAYVVSAGDGESAVISGSPADKAGIKQGDVITKVNNVTIDQTTSLTTAISRFKVGDKVTLTINRNGKTITLQATLANEPSS